MNGLRYVPVLKSKKAEWRALAHLRQVNGVEPLIEIIPAPARKIPLTPAQWADEILHTGAQHWPNHSVQLDSAYAGFAPTAFAGAHFFDYVRGRVAHLPLHLRPVVRPSDPVGTLQAAAQLAATTGAGWTLRLAEDEIAAAPADHGAAITAAINALLGSSGLTPSDTDLVLDFRGVNGPAASIANNLATSIPHLPHLSDWRTLTFVASSAPASNDAAGFTTATFQRVEWLGWQQTRQRNLPRLPDFGDYAGFSPDLPTSQGWTKHPALRYTAGDNLLIFRKKAAAGAGFSDFRSACQDLTATNAYAGPGFSWGDQRIDQICSGTATASGGGATGWREISVNHHVETVMDQLANYPGP